MRSVNIMTPGNPGNQGNRVTNGNVNAQRQKSFTKTLRDKFDLTKKERYDIKTSELMDAAWREEKNYMKETFQGKISLTKAGRTRALRRLLAIQHGRERNYEKRFSKGNVGNGPHRIREVKDDPRGCDTGSTPVREDGAQTLWGRGSRYQNTIS